MVTTFYKIYFILVMAAPGLRCCVWAFSCGKQGYSLWCVGFLLPWLLLSQRTGWRCAGSAGVVHGLQNAGSVVVLLGRSCPVACGISTDQGGSPALAGGFLSTGPPGKSGYDFVLSQESFACPQFTKVFSCDFLCKLYQFIFYIQVYFPSQISFGGLCDVS